MIKTLLFILVGISFTSCSSIEILPGLCYNDRDFTHLCVVETEEKPMTALHTEKEKQVNEKIKLSELREEMYTLDEIMKMLKALEISEERQTQ